MSSTAGTSLQSRLWPKVRGILAYGAGPALGLASGPILARAMGPDGRGQFAAIMQPLTLAGAVASIGIPAAATFFVARGKHQNLSILRRGMLLTVVFASLAYGMLIMYSEALSNAQGIDRGYLLSVWSLIYVMAVVQIMRGYLQGMGKWRLLDTERFVFACLRFVAVAVLAMAAVSTAENYALGALAAFVVAGLILWWPNKSYEGTLDRRPAIPFRSLAGYSLSAALGTIAAVANNRIDQVLLPLTASSAEVGFYAIAVTVAEVPIILGTLAARDALYESSLGGTTLNVLRSSSLYILGSLLIAIVLAVSVPLYMGPLFGTPFVGAAQSVQVLCIGTMFACLAMTFTAILSGVGRPGFSSLIPLSGLIITGVGFWVWGSEMTSYRASLVAALSQAASVVVGTILLIACRNSSRRKKPDGKFRKSVGHPR